LTSEEIYDKIVFKEINTLIEESRKNDLLLEEAPIIEFGGGKCKTLGTRFELEEMSCQQKKLAELWNQHKFLQLAREADLRFCD